MGTDFAFPSVTLAPEIPSFLHPAAQYPKDSLGDIPGSPLAAETGMTFSVHSAPPTAVG